MQYGKRHGQRAVILLLAFFAACGEKSKPQFPRELAEFHAPVKGQIPYFQGDDMNPYWSEGTTTLPGDLRQLTKFTFTTHTGAVLTPNDLKGKFVLMSFFFTRCSGICPMVTASVKRMREKIGDQRNLVFVSVTVDPEHDQARELNEFRERMKVPFDNWYFATGNKDEIYGLARQVFQSDVTVRGTKDKADFLHTEAVYLLDKDLYLRGMYRTKGLADMERLTKGLSQLRAG
ncbi:MAG: SCO family protein [Turneriella sp.]